jgi:hypothetical protein
MFLPTRMKWYSLSASPHRAASGTQSWRAPRGGTNKCTAKEGSLRTYCSIPYTGHIGLDTYALESRDDPYATWEYYI